jgi:hypothetical protein
MPIMDELTSARSEDCVTVPHIGMLHEYYSQLLDIMISMRTSQKQGRDPLLPAYHARWVRYYESYKSLGGRFTWCDFSNILNELGV